MREMRDSGIEWVGKYQRDGNCAEQRHYLHKAIVKEIKLKFCFLQHKNTELFRKANLRALSKLRKIQIYKCSKQYIKAILLSV